MQNIGAYGVEIKSVFEKLEALEIDSLQQKVFRKLVSWLSPFIFKEMKGRYIITKVFLTQQKAPF